MNAELYDQITTQLNSLANDIAASKRPDYTQESVDVLSNFKESARNAGITPLQAWLVHFHKQFSAVARHIANPSSTPSESIESRFCDLKNYIELGYALFREPTLNAAERKYQF